MKEHLLQQADAVEMVLGGSTLAVAQQVSRPHGLWGLLALAVRQREVAARVAVVWQMKELQPVAAMALESWPSLPEAPTRSIC